jgi:hypothetical protein
MPVPPLPAADLPPFAAAATRAVAVFGAPAELVLVPARRGRPGIAEAARPAFAGSPAARIVADEALWRNDGLVLTPNRYPFARRACLLWPAAPGREVVPALWTAAAAWVAATGGTALRNDVGAAATIARAHVHLVAERLPFLSALPEQRLRADWFEVPGVELVSKRVPFCLLGVRGAADRLGEALLSLAEACLAAAWNVVIEPDAAWVMPRRVETPAPHFPFALGAAELWGRWCYTDEQAFAAATGADLERALVAAGMPVLSS